MKVGIDTVQNYIAYLVSAYALFKVPRFDIKGRRLLELHEKYTLDDIALRHALLGYREGDIDRIERLDLIDFLLNDKIQELATVMPAISTFADSVPTRLPGCRLG